MLTGFVLELLAEEKRVEYAIKTGPQKKKKKERTATMKKWQGQWGMSEKGSWTRTLKGPLDQWLNRGHGGMEYYFSQALP